jgi:tetratricopeptide (TPR) repeat protein
MIARILLIWLVFTALLPPVPLRAAPAVSAERQAFDLAREALQLYKDRQFAAAAALYRRAYALQPKTLEYLFGAARSELAAGDMAAAKLLFAQVCQAAGQKHALCLRGEKHLAESEQRPAQVAVTPGAGPAGPVSVASAPTPAAAPELPLALAQLPEVSVEDPASVIGRRVSDQRSAPPRWWTWTAIGLAGAGAALGAGLAAVASERQSELEANRMADGRYDLGKISYLQAREEQQTINNRWWGAGAATVVCVLSAAVATYLLQSGAEGAR